MLEGIADKGSYEAEAILQLKINLYHRTGQDDKAWALVEANIQIESFRRKAIEGKIEERDFQAAKKLINDFLDKQDRHTYSNISWDTLLLDIALEEGDIPAIRTLAFEFIENRFIKEYYEIYKDTFSPAEWATERENLFLHYYSKDYFSNSAADLLAAEHDASRLLNYVEEYLSVNELEKYYKAFAPSYPKKTLELFKRALVSYAEQHTGRFHYKRILSLLKDMARIKGGKKAALELAAEFKMRYKNRRAMIEILGEFN